MPEPYRLLRRLGESSSVFEGRHRTTNRAVAVQLVKGVQSEAQLLEYVGAAALLHDPSTVRLLDTGVISGTVSVGFWVREFVNGTNLKTFVGSNGKLSVPITLSIVRQILDSLAEAHALGIMHGRLCPEHVLVEAKPGRSPRARVIGYFGPGRLLRAKPSEFSAPEFATTRSPQSDLYSLARLMDLCLNGQLSAAPGVTPGPSAFWKRALAEDPTWRFGSAREFRDALDSSDWSQVEPAPLKRVHFDQFRLLESNKHSELMPARHELMSTRPPCIWVLEGDRAVEDASLRSALTALRAEHDVRFIAEPQRDKLLAQLRAGKVALPWVVVFGGMHVLTHDPLLATLTESGELCRLLVSSHQNLELLQSCVERGGLDGHLCVPTSAADVGERVVELLKRTRRLSNHYDSIRLALRSATDQVGEVSRELAATDRDDAVVSGTIARGTSAGRSALG